MSTDTPIVTTVIWYENRIAELQRELAESETKRRENIVKCYELCDGSLLLSQAMHRIRTAFPEDST